MLSRVNTVVDSKECFSDAICRIIIHVFYGRSWKSWNRTNIETLQGSRALLPRLETKHHLIIKANKDNNKDRA